MSGKIRYMRTFAQRIRKQEIVEQKQMSASKQNHQQKLQQKRLVLLKRMQDKMAGDTVLFDPHATYAIYTV